MAQARGSSTVVAYYEETAFNVDPGTPDGKILYLVSDSLSANQNLLDANTISGSRPRVRPVQGNISVSGQISLELSAQNHGTLIKHALGQVSTGGAGPYTHTITQGELPTGGLVIERNYGTVISGAGQFIKFNGCRVNGMTLTFPQEGFVTAALDIVGARYEISNASDQYAGAVSAPLDGTLTDTGHTAFSSFEASITEGGSSIAYVTQVEVRIENGIEPVYAIGGAGLARDLPAGFSSVSGTLTALFESADLLSKAVAGTETALVITLSRGTGLGSAGNEKIVFTVEEMMYQFASPPVEGPGGLLITLPFRGYKVGANLGLKAVVYNALSAI